MASSSSRPVTRSRGMGAMIAAQQAAEYEEERKKAASKRAAARFRRIKNNAIKASPEYKAFVTIKYKTTLAGRAAWSGNDVEAKQQETLIDNFCVIIVGWCDQEPRTLNDMVSQASHRSKHPGPNDLPGMANVFELFTRYRNRALQLCLSAGWIEISP